NRQGAQAAPAVAVTPAAGAPAAQGPTAGPQRPGGRASSKTPLAIGGALLTIFVALEGWSVVRGRRALLTEPGSTVPEIVGSNYGRETGRALLGYLAITVVAW